MIGLMIVLDAFLTYGEYGFSSMGSWSYSKECAWDLRTKLCCVTSGKGNIRRVTLQKFDIRYIMF